MDTPVPFSSFSEPVPVPVISAECINKTVSVKCQVQQKSKDETFIIELTYDKGKKTQKNATKLELQTRYSGTFRCTVRNEVSKKTAEKVIKCSGKKNLSLPESARADPQSLMQLHVFAGLVQVPGPSMVPGIPSLMLPQLLGVDAVAGMGVALSAWHSPALSHPRPPHPAAACPTATLMASLLLTAGRPS